MLYYILPPIIIVLGTAALIFFLFRKVSEYPNSEHLLDGKKDSEKVRAMSGALGQFGLRVLERTMQKFKLMSLKFHNISNEWFHSIRKKRVEGMMAEQKQTEKEEDRRVEQKAGDATGAEKKEFPQARRQMRPLVSEVSAGGKKNQLEEVLIKRIAINPRDIEAYERLGDYYLEQLNLKDSLECYKQVLHLSPAHLKARARIRKIERMLK